MNGHQFLQLSVNGVINGSAYGLLGVAFALILGVTGRFHFAFAFTYALTAYVAAVGAADWGLPAAAAIALGLVAGAVAGVAIEMLVYRPLGDHAGAKSLLVIFVASLGVSIAGETAIRLLWGLDHPTRNFSAFTVRNWSVQDLNFTSLDVLSVVVIWACVFGMTAFLRYGDRGLRIKAVRANPEMAQAVGIDSHSVYRAVFAIGSLLGGVAAILYALKYAAVPEMGQRPVFYALVVAFVGGTARSPWKVALTGVGLGLLESWSGEWVSAQWSSMVVFAVLFLYLTQHSVRPVGSLNVGRLMSRQPARARG